ncbi:MAG: phosphoribosylaminoimidazole carboxylase ade2 [Cirrosporium novae-zelandiae]|nr:MAG: phosphoribosylaminoimidazole carboxylase ade2 [Cirrosporium novae-zelandiae]
MDDRTIGVLGGGQLGRMLCEAASRRNINVAILDKSGAPAKQINPSSSNVNGSFSDPQAIRKLAKQCDILTVEIEHVDTYVLEELEKETREQGKSLEIQPSWETIRVIQDKYAQKERLIEGKVAIADSIPIPTASEEELKRASETLGLPFMLKARTNAYDGRGNFPVKSLSDFKPALEALKNRPLYGERWANFTKELAVMVVKTKDEANPSSWESSTLSYPTVETIHEDSICKLCYAPARAISDETNIAAQNLARRAIASFRGKGIFGVEMFLLEDGNLLVNEIAPRPHNSGHYTIEACPLSQYDAHILSILNRPIPKEGLELLNPAIMLNILGGANPYSYLKLANAADAVAAKVHLYGKGEARPGRKLGHITVARRSMEKAEQVIEPLIKMADELRAERFAPKEDSKVSTPAARPQTPASKPLVGIVTGSISDQPVLEPCYKILKDFGIPFEKGIKSAHRTPDLMAEYARDATERGVKVIIAAAGGAAHLPGMVAAFSKVMPVIGIPVKPSIGDGMDSVLSILNMPRGVPVFTVSVNNSTNAALGAARILGRWDERIEERLREYMDRAAEESTVNDRKLQE